MSFRSDPHSARRLDDLAQAILAHLGACPDLVEALIAETGMMPTDLRRLAGDPGTGLAVALVDFICATDDRLVAFAQGAGWQPAEVDRIRQALEAGILR